MTTHSPETLALAARAIERFGWTMPCPAEPHPDDDIDVSCDACGAAAGQACGTAPLAPAEALATCPAGFPLCDALKVAWAQAESSSVSKRRDGTCYAEWWGEHVDDLSDVYGEGEGELDPVARIAALLAAHGDTDA